MCGRYTLIRLNDILERFPWIEHAPPDLLPRYNIAPTQPLLVISNDHPDRFDYYVWGLVPAWAKDPSIASRMINARAETLAEKPAFNKPLRRRRCLIPADGFYEWKPDPAGKKKGAKIPTLIQMKDHKTFAFAGLWEHWQSPNGTEILSATIITTQANDLLKPIHDRMPVIVPPDRYQDWLDPEERDPYDMLEMVGPYPANEMESFPVSTLVNSARNEDPKCIEPVEKETLF